MLSNIAAGPPEQLVFLAEKRKNKAGEEYDIFDLFIQNLKCRHPQVVKECAYGITNAISSGNAEMVNKIVREKPFFSEIATVFATASQPGRNQQLNNEQLTKQILDALHDALGAGDVLFQNHFASQRKYIDRLCKPICFWTSFKLFFLESKDPVCFMPLF